MSEADGFLARWSRRKRSSTSRKLSSPRTSSADDAAEATVSAPLRQEAGEPRIEPPPLPPIESLDAASDITPFLARGVPVELTRQALRKAWQSDPVIRDFVGLSENAWDFNAPDGVPGFGSLTQAEVRRLVERVIGKSDSADPSPDTSRPAAAEPPPAPAGETTPAQTGVTPPVIATRTEPDPQTPRAAVAGRRHGAD